MNFALTETSTLRLTITLTRPDADGLQRLLNDAVGRYREIVVNLGWLSSVPESVMQVLGFGQRRAACLGGRLLVTRTDAAFQGLVRRRTTKQPSGWLVGLVRRLRGC